MSTEPAKKPRIRVAEAVESGVEGFLLFLVRYVRTGFTVLGTPRKGVRRLLADRHAPKPAYVLPLTYLSIGLFLISLLGQIAGTLILDWIWYTQEIAEKVTDALSKEISLIKVAVQALPGVVVVSMFVGLLSLALRRRAPMSKRLASLVLSYAFGAQATALFLVAFGLTVISTIAGNWRGPDGEAATNLLSILVYGVILGGLAITFIGPLVFAFHAFRIRRLWRKSRWLAFNTVAVLSLSLLLGHSAVLWATRLPNQVIEQAKGPTSPSLSISGANYQLERGQIKLRTGFLIKNRGTKPISWETVKLGIGLYVRPAEPGKKDCKQEGLPFTVLQVVDDTGTPRRFASVEAGATQWFEATAVVDATPTVRSRLSKEPELGVGIRLFLADGAMAESCSYLTLQRESRQ